MTSARYRIEARGLTKRFGRNLVFKDLNLELETGNSLCVTGPNGSGKSTLLKILAGVLAPSEGKVMYTDIDRGSVLNEWIFCIGYSGPLINPYDDLTAMENISFTSAGAGPSRIDSLLHRFGLTAHKDKKIRFYSSGMKQRLRFILAELNDPPVLLLDEPGTNLDESGRHMLRAHLDEASKEKIIILATNDGDDQTICGREIRLG
jgi:heme exporter protein A